MKNWIITFAENGDEYEGWIKLKGNYVYIDDTDTDVLHVDDKIIQTDEYWTNVEEIK